MSTNFRERLEFFATAKGGFYVDNFHIPVAVCRMHGTAFTIMRYFHFSAIRHLNRWRRVGFPASLL